MPSLLQKSSAMWGMECIVGLLDNVLSEEEKLQARDGVYEILIEVLETYELQVDRMQRRSKPLQN